MTRVARLRTPKPLPVATMLGAIDVEGRRSAELARDLGVPAVRAVLPARSGTLRRETKGRVGKTADGYNLQIAPSRRPVYRSGVSANEVFRFVDAGTGLFGRLHRPIKPRKTDGAFRLPNGWVSGELEGQRPQHIAQRGFTAADALVTRALVNGADRAARAAERAGEGL